MASIRQGIPHVYSTLTPKGNLTPSLNIDQFKALTKGGLLFIDYVTEKTDGQTFMIGYDSDGFWSMHSGSGADKARVGSDHVERAQRRGNSIEAATAFSVFHNSLLGNIKFQKWFEFSGHNYIRGEMFNRRLCREFDPGRNKIKLVHTEYDADKLGSIGMFVIHSSLPENYCLNLSEIKEFSNREIVIDCDRLNIDHGYIEVEDLYKLPDIHYDDKFHDLKVRLHNRIVEYLNQFNIAPKWGDETEGYIIHPSHRNPGAPRFKIVSESFKESKANGW